MSAERVFDGEEDTSEGDPASEGETRAAAERLYTTLFIPLNGVLEDPKRTRRLGLTNTQKIRVNVLGEFYARFCAAAPALDESELPGISAQVRKKTSSLADQYEAAIKAVGEGLARLVKEKNINRRDARAIEKLVHESGLYEQVHRQLSSNDGLSGVETLVSEDIPLLVERYLTATKMVEDALGSFAERNSFSQRDLDRITDRLAEKDLYSRTYRKLVRGIAHTPSWIIGKVSNVVKGYLEWYEKKRAEALEDNRTETLKLYVRGGSAYPEPKPAQAAAIPGRRVIPAIAAEQIH